MAQLDGMSFKNVSYISCIKIIWPIFQICMFSIWYVAKGIPRYLGAGGNKVVRVYVCLKNRALKCLLL